MGRQVRVGCRASDHGGKVETAAALLLAKRPRRSVMVVSLPGCRAVVTVARGCVMAFRRVASQSALRVKFAGNFNPGGYRCMRRLFRRSAVLEISGRRLLGFKLFVRSGSGWADAQHRLPLLVFKAYAFRVAPVPRRPWPGSTPVAPITGA